MTKLLLAFALLSLSVFAQVQTPVVTVQSDPGGSCRRSSPTQWNSRTGQYWQCQGNASQNWTNGVWTKVSPADAIVTTTIDPTGNACDAGAIAIKTPGGTLYTCQSGVYAASGGTLPVGSGNKVVATPADGSSGLSALRAVVAADIPVSLPAVSIGGNAATATALAPGVLPVCTDVGGSHLNWAGTSYLCGTSVGAAGNISTLVWTPGTVVDGGYATNTITLAGAEIGRPILLGVPSNLPVGVFAIPAIVASSGVVTVGLINLSGVSRTFSALTFTLETIN